MAAAKVRGHCDADRRALAVLQPGYLPWLGFFDLLDRVDVFVIYDDVAFDKNGWRNRNRIKTSQGISWLTVPVLTSGRTGQLIHDVAIDPHLAWQRKHIRSIREAYARAPYFDLYFNALEALLDQPWQRLADLDVAVVRLMASWLGLEHKSIVLSSTLGIAGERNERLIAICEHFGSTTYISGNLAQSYLDVEGFERRGVGVEWQNYAHPVYSQLHGPFEPYLSALDLIFNNGPQSLNIIRDGSSKLDSKPDLAHIAPEAHP
jgi:hypothetical protein